MRQCIIETQTESEAMIWTMVNKERMEVLESLSNGGLVLKRKPMADGPFTQPSEIVLCKLSHNNDHPYATWQRNIPERGGDGSTYWGHYFTTYEAAVSDFHKRG